TTEALAMLRRLGAPILLIVDLALRPADGFELIDAVRHVDGHQAEIIAWSAIPAVRAAAPHRLAGLKVRILSGSVAPGILRDAIERALRDAETPQTAASLASKPVAELGSPLSLDSAAALLERRDG